MIRVVAAVIERDGRVLIGRRKPEQSHPLQWEFPGGKVEPGETPEQALARELAEELAVREVEGREIMRQEFTYPGRDPIELIFYSVESFTGEPENRVFHEMRWERRPALPSFDFVEGDREFLRRFREG